jgi:2-dehydro-3-deoxyphosphooctonate aldolase (KDO 8-P synthase)
MDYLFPVIAGPCQLESATHAIMIACHLLELQQELPIKIIFKGSFDKANRTSVNTKRGVGISEGLEILAAVKDATNLPVITDVHLPEHAVACAKVCDILQIPAFLCRQTDLLIAAGETGRFINIKKGQFLSPHDMQHAAEKVLSTGNQNILLCERGTCFGYRDLVVDMRSLLIMQNLDWPVIYDATHSVQNMGGAGGMSGGSREFIIPLLRGAIATGCDGIFLECHENPAGAPSDGAVMIQLDSVKSVLQTVVNLKKIVYEKCDIKSRRFQVLNNLLK